MKRIHLERTIHLPIRLPGNMNRSRFIFFILFFFYAGQVLAQKASIIKIGQLENLMHSKSETIQVINFWATWCAPCVKELPLFEEVNNRQGVRVTLINLDYADQINKVNNFLSRKNIKSNVLLLDEIDYNSWIDKVDERWQGAIPATLVINSLTGKRKFIDRELKEGELELAIQEVSN